MLNDIINGLIIDLEIDVACLLDSIDEITTQDLSLIHI